MQINQNDDETRLQYLMRVLRHYMLAHGHATIEYDEAECDGMCLAQDIENEIDDVGINDTRTWPEAAELAPQDDDLTIAYMVGRSSAPKVSADVVERIRALLSPADVCQMYLEGFDAAKQRVIRMIEGAK